MAISIGSGSGFNTYEYMSGMANLSKESESANAVSSGIKNINSNTDKEEAINAIKEFESYFLEQFLSKVEEEFMDDDDSNSRLTNFFMEKVNKEMAEKLIETSGERLTQQLYEQMARNYNLNITDATETPKASES